MVVRKRARTIVSGLTRFEALKEQREPFTLYHPEHVVRRATFEAGGGLGWTLTAVETPRRRPAPWKFVIVTGAPSWAENWADFLTLAPQDREIVVVDRPGFGCSGPKTCISDIRVQAAALAPLLKAPFGQKVILVGHSYGAAIATLMAAANPGKVAGVVLLSGYFGEFGRTSRFLVKLGSRLFKIIPRDIRHGIMEVTGQAPQLGYFKDALSRLRVPVHILHGEKDDYAPLEAAEKLVREVRTRRPVRFERLANADHFPQDSQPQALWEALQRCVPQRRTLNLMEIAKEKLAPRSAANAA
jgi:pimeloyl-ACP methyl ester carboxylesterase